MLPYAGQAALARPASDQPLVTGPPRTGPLVTSTGRLPGFYWLMQRSCIKRPARDPASGATGVRRSVPDPADDLTLDEDVAAVTSAVLTASRLLVAVSLQSLTAAHERVTLPQFRMLVLLAGHGETNLVTLAERLVVNPSTALRMVDRLADGVLSAAG